MRVKDKNGFWYRVDKLSVYLPALAMALLALGTFWLVRNAPSFVADQAAEIVTDEPDYRMSDFAIRTYNDHGNLISELNGDKARHFPVTDILEVDNVRIRSISDEGRITTAKANVGKSFNGGEEIMLIGNAIVIQEPFEDQPRLEFQGEELKIWPDEDRVQSELPVVLFRGADRMTGNNLTYDKNTEVFEVNGRVRTTILPVENKAK